MVLYTLVCVYTNYIVTHLIFPKSVAAAFSMSPYLLLSMCYAGLSDAKCHEKLLYNIDSKVNRILSRPHHHYRLHFIKFIFVAGCGCGGILR